MNDFKFIKKGLTDFNMKADFFSSLSVYCWNNVVILILGIFSWHAHFSYFESKNKFKTD